MITVLHLLTRPSEDWVQALIQAQKTLPEHHVEVADLTQPNPDYHALVGRVFDADSIATW